MSSKKPVHLPNKHLKDLKGDRLYHFDIALDDNQTVSHFTNVKIVCVGGTASRMEELALHLANTFQHRVGHKDRFDYSFKTSRFSGFVVGSVFCVNHGMGTPSTSILLQEVFKLLQKAGSTDVTLIRVGTAGGIGVDAGTIIVSTGALSPGFLPVYTKSSLGKVMDLPVEVDQELANEIFNLGSRDSSGMKLVKGKTYCADDFFESQGRLDGAFCEFDHADRLEFLHQLQNEGVVNIEMESACIFALCHRAGIKAAVLCGILVNRLESDSIDMSKCSHVVTDLVDLVTLYIQRKLKLI